MGVALGDCLNTGRFSIVVTHFSDEYAALYRNDGNMSFTDVSYKSGIAPSTALHAGSFKADPVIRGAALWLQNGWGAL